MKPSSLTPGQQQQADRAREVLAAEHGYDLASMAGRLGVLEWHLGEMLALIGQLSSKRTEVQNEDAPDLPAESVSALTDLPFPSPERAALVEAEIRRQLARRAGPRPRAALHAV